MRPSKCRVVRRFDHTRLSEQERLKIQPSLPITTFSAICECVKNLTDYLKKEQVERVLAAVHQMINLFAP